MGAASGTHGGRRGSPGLLSRRVTPAAARGRRPSDQTPLPAGTLVVLLSMTCSAAPASAGTARSRIRAATAVPPGADARGRGRRAACGLATTLPVHHARPCAPIACGNGGQIEHDPWGFCDHGGSRRTHCRWHGRCNPSDASRVPAGTASGPRDALRSTTGDTAGQKPGRTSGSISGARRSLADRPSPAAPEPMPPTG